MIIPVRCMTCGNMLASKYRRYEDLVSKYQGSDTAVKPLITNNIDIVSKTQTPEAKALDEVGLVRYCCRRHFITHTETVRQL